MSVPTGRFRRLRPLAAAAGAAVLVVGVVGPAQSQTAAPGSGTSDLQVVPASLTVDGLPVDVDTTIGTLIASATNVDNPVARLALEGLSAAGDVAPALDYSTADGDQSGNESRQVGAGGVSAAVNLVDWAVQSTSDSALTKLSALGGELTTPLGLGTTIDAQQVSTSATPTASGSAVTLQLSGLELGLDDLLPADVLDALPLGTLLDLIDTLGLPLSGDLTSRIASFDQLQSTLEGAVAAAGDLAGAQGLLSDAIAGDATLSTLQNAVTSATSNVTELPGDRHQPPEPDQPTLQLPDQRPRSDHRHALQICHAHLAAHHAAEPADLGPEHAGQRPIGADGGAGRPRRRPGRRGQPVAADRRPGQPGERPDQPARRPAQPARRPARRARPVAAAPRPARCAGRRLAARHR